MNAVSKKAQRGQAPLRPAKIAKFRQSTKFFLLILCLFQLFVLSLQTDSNPKQLKDGNNISITQTQLRTASADW